MLLSDARKLMYEALEKRGLFVALYTDSKPKNRYTKAGEVACPGYKAGGKPLETTCNESGIYIASDVAWPDCSIEASSALVYEKSGGGGVMFFPFPSAKKSVRDEFLLRFGDKPLVTFE